MYSQNNSPDPNYPPPLRVQPDYNGVLILVLGICGLTVCGCCAPFAWSMGATALQRMDDEGYDGNERNLANIGRILGIIGTLFILLALLVVLMSGGLQKR